MPRQMGYFFWSKVSLHKKLLFGILIFLKFLNIVKGAFLELKCIPKVDTGLRK